LSNNQGYLWSRRSSAASCAVSAYHPHPQLESIVREALSVVGTVGRLFAARKQRLHSARHNQRLKRRQHLAPALSSFYQSVIDSLGHCSFNTGDLALSSHDSVSPSDTLLFRLGEVGTILQTCPTISIFRHSAKSSCRTYTSQSTPDIEDTEAGFLHAVV
jgi:hypothetical protein